ncbi:hypothetical protein BDQ12DRAFT_729976 [Crucibulum laeve]|uniref:DUF6699 domain-containing protein n=1 Tax=Crucibulum laeve TaxID=68775 RepID=A0A5C3LE06_9AGAR|nr:hypothetical protein BDQ12DRAFT_729976 [Crucibulum laeve]
MLLDTAYIASAAGPSTGMWYLDTVDRLSGNAHRNAGARSKAPVRRKGQQYYAHHAGGPKTSSTRSGGLTISSRPCLSTDTKTTLSIVTSGFAPMFPLPMEGIICHAQYSEGLDDTSLLPPSSPVHPAIHSAHHHHQSPTGPEALMHMHVHQRPLYAYIPLPPLTTTPVELNPLLKHTSPIPLEYDITIPPSNAVLRARVGNHGVWVCANATQPGVQSMVLRTSVVGRPIVVHASTVNYAAVTIWDALLAVHDALREDAGLERSGSSHACTETERRSKEEERMHLGMGLSKNDENARAQLLFLVGRHRRWAGLEESTTESDVWILHLR